MPVKTEPSPFASLLPSGLTSSPHFSSASALRPNISSHTPNAASLSLPSALQLQLQPSHLAAASASATPSLRSLNALSSFRTDKPPQVFAGLRFLLDLPPDAPLKEKMLWRRRLLDGGAQIAYSMSKRVRISYNIFVNVFNRRSIRP